MFLVVKSVYDFSFFIANIPLNMRDEMSTFQVVECLRGRGRFELLLGGHVVTFQYLASRGSEHAHKQRLHAAKSYGVPLLTVTKIKVVYHCRSTTKS